MTGVGMNVVAAAFLFPLKIPAVCHYNRIKSE